MGADQNSEPGRRRPSRRQFLFGGAVVGVGAAAAIGADFALRDATPGQGTAGLNGLEIVPFYGEHQAGVETPAQAHAVFLGLNLRPDVDKAAIARMMGLLTDDAARLTQGEPALADTEIELAQAPARLTVTFGFGPGLVDRVGGKKPDWLAPLPSFAIDRLEEANSHGDLLIHVGADDPLTVAHAVRMLVKDARSFAEIKWSQAGFRRAYGTEAAGTTMRNLFGQVDGTVNPKPGTTDFDEVVWSDDGWLRGGTGLVLRRIHMNLDTWDELDRPGRELSVGRYLSNGAPLTGSKEDDEPDFDAVTPIGFPVIPEFSHVRRSRSDNPRERIFRRAYNYDDSPVGSGSVSDSGLLFASYQADVARQFTPIQRRLDELDLLNQWTTPVGSAVFAIPPGCAPGGFVGETLLA